jgi:hypothetical protein
LFATCAVSETARARVFASNEAATLPSLSSFTSA